MRRLSACASAPRSLFQPSLFTTTVGVRPSAAHYYLHDAEEVISALKALAVASTTPEHDNKDDKVADEQLKALERRIKQQQEGGRFRLGGLGGTSSFRRPQKDDDDDVVDDDEDIDDETADADNDS